jgi:signal transduction histidine kinase/DNA-binding response OmpR family regulator
LVTAVAAQGEVAALKDNINEMIRNLRETTIKNNEQDWLKTNLAKFSRMLQGQKDMLTVGRLILSELAPVVSAQQAVFYTLDAPKDESEAAKLKLLAGYAIGSDHAREYRLGESLVGQCAVEGKKLSLKDVPEHYIRISSGLGEAKPKHIIVLPVLFEGQVKGVLELASFERFSQTHEVFLDQLMESIGIVLNTIVANMRTEDLLEQSQSLARELQSQQEELQKTNQQLEEKAGLLASQNAEVERKNQEVEQARAALEDKAAQLALTSKYKSEFLANMSHELRTPLNSLLILSDQLSRNPDGNLLGKQVDYAKTIHASGNDLLSLINDILDLSKIESGTVTVDASDLSLTDLRDYIERTFAHVAESRNLKFNIILDENLPRIIHTDTKRLQQVVKNLLSNAFKFTESGSVSIHISRPTHGWSEGNDSLNRATGGVLAFSVIDTGIGIPMEKQQIIFEAFQQADGSTSRKYGGTGLGLAISREISLMLGGEIRLESQPGHGSRFTLYLPAVYAPTKSSRRQLGSDRLIERLAIEPQSSLAELPEPGRLTNDFGDDRDHLSDGEPVLLVVDNDRAFATYLMEAAHAQGFKVLVTARGGAAISLARQYRPSAIILDIKLSDIEGWRVLQSIKNDLSTRHIPVQVISNDDDRERALRLGAFGMLTKPVSNDQITSLLEHLRAFAAGKTRRLLVIEDNPTQRDHVVQLVAGADVETVAVGSAHEGLALLEKEHFDCVVLDLGLPDTGSGLELVEQVQRLIAETFTPLIIYTGKDLTPHDDALLRQRSKAIVVKDFRASELLLDEVATCLHRPHQSLSAVQRKMLDELHRPEHVLKGRKVLVVDDDIRNIFAMTSLLERYEMVVTSAEDGRHAIDALGADPAIEIVLMDIMMPEMDGYDTMRAIRSNPEYKSLPIIALTAKAMKGDREKCLDAGASDYVSKPVDTDHLLSTLCVWLYQPAAMVGPRE